MGRRRPGDGQLAEGLVGVVHVGVSLVGWGWSGCWMVRRWCSSWSNRSSQTRRLRPIQSTAASREAGSSRQGRYWAWRPRVMSPACFEDLQVPRDGLQADVERLGQLVHRRLAVGQPGEDRPAGRVGQGGEGAVEEVVGHRNQPISCLTGLLSMTPGSGVVKRGADHPPPAAGSGERLVELAQGADELEVGRVVDRAGDDRDGVGGQRRPQGGQQLVGRGDPVARPPRSSRRRRRSRGSRRWCRRRGPARGPSSS